MYTKGFWVIFASYQKIGSKWIRGSVPDDDEMKFQKSQNLKQGLPQTMFTSLPATGTARALEEFNIYWKKKNYNVFFFHLLNMPKKSLT